MEVLLKRTFFSTLITGFAWFLIPMGWFSLLSTFLSLMIIKWEGK